VDKGTFGGVLLAITGILAGLLLEGGRIAQILQPTAAMIVFGGTIGAVLVQFPLPTVIQATKSLAHVFRDANRNPKEVVREVVSYAQKARKDGIVSLDSQLPAIQDSFLKKSLMLAIDGTETQELRKMMELELDNQEERSEKLAQVF